MSIVVFNSWSFQNNLKTESDLPLVSPLHLPRSLHAFATLLTGYKTGFTSHSGREPAPNFDIYIIPFFLSETATRSRVVTPDSAMAASLMSTLSSEALGCGEEAKWIQSRAIFGTRSQSVCRYDGEDRVRSLSGIRVHLRHGSRTYTVPTPSSGGSSSSTPSPITCCMLCLLIAW
jgi:hypothetical protein